MTPGEVQPWTVVATNLPRHARNAIHTDAGAQAAGFPRALVAGVTTYAYLTHPIVAGWGMPWLEAGGAEVRFRRPVFDGDALSCVPEGDGDEVVVNACIGDGDEPRAVVRAVPLAAAPVMRAGKPLRSRRFELTGEWGSDYGRQAGDDLAIYRDHGLVHPAVWPAIANDVVHQELARGAWIHTRSIVRHHGVARAGVTADVHATVVHRFERHGERAVLDVLIEVAGRPIASLEHEAIIALPGS